MTIFRRKNGSNEKSESEIEQHEIRISALEIHTIWARKQIGGLHDRLADVEMIAAFWSFDQSWKSKMAQAISDHFSEDELIGLCLDFDIDYETLDGRNKKAKARSLAGLFYRRNNHNVLLSACMKLRPLVDWPIPGKR